MTTLPKLAGRAEDQRPQRRLPAGRPRNGTNDTAIAAGQERGARGQRGPAQPAEPRRGQRADQRRRPRSRRSARRNPAAPNLACASAGSATSNAPAMTKFASTAISTITWSTRARRNSRQMLVSSLARGRGPIGGTGRWPVASAARRHRPWRRAVAGRRGDGSACVRASAPAQPAETANDAASTAKAAVEPPVVTRIAAEHRPGQAADLDHRRRQPVAGLQATRRAAATA